MGCQAHVIWVLGLLDAGISVVTDGAGACPGGKEKVKRQKEKVKR